MGGNNKGSSDFKSNAQMSSLRAGSRSESGSQHEEMQEGSRDPEGQLPGALPLISASRGQVEVPRSREQQPPRSWMAKKAIKGGEVTLFLSSQSSFPSYSHAPSHSQPFFPPPLLAPFRPLCAFGLQTAPEIAARGTQGDLDAEHGPQTLTRGSGQT